jgi:hypothetical protein
MLGSTLLSPLSLDHCADLELKLDPKITCSELFGILLDLNHDVKKLAVEDKAKTKGSTELAARLTELKTHVEEFQRIVVAQRENPAVFKCMENLRTVLAQAKEVSGSWKCVTVLFYSFLLSLSLSFKSSMASFNLSFSCFLPHSFSGHDQGTSDKLPAKRSLQESHPHHHQ